MTLATVLKSLDRAFRPLVEKERGTLAIAEDPNQALAILSNAPKGWRLTLQIGGDTVVENSRSSATTVELLAIIQTPEGLALRSGKNTFDPADGRESILARLEWVRAHFRGVIWDDGAGHVPPGVNPRWGLNYQGFAWTELPEGTLGITLTARFLLNIFLDPPTEVTVIPAAD